MSLANPSGSKVLPGLPLSALAAKRGRPRGNRKVEHGKVFVARGKPIAELRVDPAIVARLATYGGRIAAKAGLTVDQVREIARRYA